MLGFFLMFQVFFSCFRFPPAVSGFLKNFTPVHAEIFPDYMMEAPDQWKFRPPAARAVVCVGLKPPLLAITAARPRIFSRIQEIDFSFFFFTHSEFCGGDEPSILRQLNVRVWAWPGRQGCWDFKGSVHPRHAVRVQL